MYRRRKTIFLSLASCIHPFFKSPCCHSWNVFIIVIMTTIKGSLSERGAGLAKGENYRDKFKAILNDPYDPVQNPDGFVNLGTAENVRRSYPMALDYLEFLPRLARDSSLLVAFEAKDRDNSSSWDFVESTRSTVKLTSCNSMQCLMK